MVRAVHVPWPTMVPGQNAPAHGVGATQKKKDFFFEQSVEVCRGMDPKVHVENACTKVRNVDHSVESIMPWQIVFNEGI